MNMYGEYVRWIHPLKGKEAVYKIVVRRECVECAGAVRVALHHSTRAMYKRRVPGCMLAFIVA